MGSHLTCGTMREAFSRTGHGRGTSGLGRAYQLVSKIEYAVFPRTSVIVQRNCLLREVGQIARAKIVAHGRSGSARITVGGPTPAHDVIKVHSAEIYAVASDVCRVGDCFVQLGAGEQNGASWRREVAHGDGLQLLL